MQFIDLGAQYKRIEEDVRRRMDAVLAGQRFIMGAEVRELEEKLAAFAGVKHVVSCASGTDALVIPLMAYELTREDAVFVPSFTYFASAEAITLAGGTPVFVDSDPATFNISAESLETAISQVLDEGVLKPRGIIAVDLFGQPADYGAIADIAVRYGLFLLEDGAQGFGGILDGKRACSFGNVAATSFFPAKPLGCYGDGGAIFTDDSGLAALCESIRMHGKGTDKYDNVRIGLNGRLDTLQAAVLLAKIEVFEGELVARNRIAGWYTERLQDLFVTPTVIAEATSAWAQYTLQTVDGQDRNAIIGEMKKRGIPVMVYYRTPVHLATAYDDFGYCTGMLPVCEDQARRVFSLPMHPYLEESDVDAVCKVLREVVG